MEGTVYHDDQASMDQISEESLNTLLEVGPFAKTHVLQWERFKSVLREKYIFEDMTLRQVKWYMHSTYQFEASVNQYQRMFKRWEFFKNNKRKNCEDIILSLKRAKLDYGDLDLKGLPNVVKFKFQRALCRYDIPGLEYRRLLENLSDEESSGLNVRSETYSTCSTSWRTRPHTKTFVELSQRNEFVGQYVEVLPIFLFTSVFQNELIRSAGQILSGAESLLQLYVQPLQSTLRQTSYLSDDLRRDTETLFPQTPMTKLEAAIATMIYQVSNCLLDGPKISHLLKAIVQVGAESILNSIFTSRLQTARAFSRRVLAVLFGTMLPEEGLSEAFKKVFGLLLQTDTDIDLSVNSSRHSTTHWPFRISLLQQSLDLGHLDVAVRLVQAGSHPNWCAVHGISSSFTRMSCCKLHPMILVVENHYESGWGKNEFCSEDVLDMFEKSNINYPKDVSMATLTNQHNVLQSLVDQGIEPDSMVSLSGNNHTATTRWYSALQYSVDRCDKAASSILLKAGANPYGCSFETVHNYLKSRKACGKGRVSEEKTQRVVYRILASPSAVTPFAIACSKENLDMAQFLLHHNAPINGCQFDPCCRRTRSSNRDDTAYYRCYHDCGQHNSLTHRLEDLLAALERIPENSRSSPRLPLHLRADHVDSWDFEPVLGCAPLQIAVLASRLETVEFLLAHGADIEGCHGLTPLALATYKRNKLLIETLLKSGADPFGFTQNGPYVSAVAVAALANDVHSLNSLLCDNSERLSMGHDEDMSPWRAVRRGNSSEAYHFLRVAMLKGQLAQRPSSTVDLLEAMLRFDEKDIDSIKGFIEIHAGEICQADGTGLLILCVSRGTTGTLRALLDAGIRANNPLALAVALIKTTEPEGLDILLEETYGVSPSTVIMLLAMIHDHCSGDWDRTQLFSTGRLQKLVYQWFNLQPSPRKSDTSALLRILLSDTFFPARTEIPPCVYFQQYVCDLILFLLAATGEFSDCCSEYEETLVQIAAHKASLIVLMALVKAGARVNATAAKTRRLNKIVSDGERPEIETLPKTALQYAVENCDIPMVSWLLEHEADVDAPGSEMVGPTALQIAVGKADAGMVTLLLDGGANVNEPGPNYFGRNALQLAVENKNEGMIRLLLKAGADVNGPCSKEHGRTALQLAVDQKNDGLLEMLLQKGAEVNQSGAPYFGRTALQLASEVGSVNLVERLIDLGADINWPAAYCGGVTALQAAAVRGSFHICQVLVAKGADVNANGSYVEGRTAIEGAAEHGRLDILKWLLDLSVERFESQSKSKDGFELPFDLNGALYLARQSGMGHIVDLLDDYLITLEEKQTKEPQTHTERTRTSSHTSSVQQEIDGSAVDEGARTTSLEIFVDSDMKQGLADIAADTSEQFSDLLKQFVNPEMLE